MVDSERAMAGVCREVFLSIRDLKARQVVVRFQEVEIHFVWIFLTGNVQAVQDLYCNWLAELEFWLIHDAQLDDWRYRRHITRQE